MKEVATLRRPINNAYATMVSQYTERRIMVAAAFVAACLTPLGWPLMRELIPYYERTRALSIISDARNAQEAFAGISAVSYEGNVIERLELAWGRVGRGDQYFDLWMLGPNFQCHKEESIVEAELLRRPELIKRVAQGANWGATFTAEQVAVDFRERYFASRRSPAMAMYCAWITGRADLIGDVSHGNAEQVYLEAIESFEDNLSYMYWNAADFCFVIDERARDARRGVPKVMQVADATQLPFDDWSGEVPAGSGGRWQLDRLRHIYSGRLWGR